MLRVLRQALLVARWPWELQKILYELEEYLAQHPHSVEGRILKDSVQTAIQRMKEKERASAPAEPCWRKPAGADRRDADAMRSRPPVGCIIMLLAAILCGLVYLLSFP
jgi:hypothetical protein